MRHFVENEKGKVHAVHVENVLKDGIEIRLGVYLTRPNCQAVGPLLWAVL